MRRSNYEYPTKHQNGSDYYSHVERMARTPSVLTEVPHYPHGQSMFHRDVTLEEEEYGGQHQQHQQHHQHHQQEQQHRPEVHKTVEVTERVTQCDKNGNCTVLEETVDVDADTYIEQKHKGFELWKWNTFRRR